MAYQIIEREFVAPRDNEEETYRITAVLDAANDLAALGTEYAPGSIAMVAASGIPAYMMNASGEWQEV